MTGEIRLQLGVASVSLMWLFGAVALSARPAPPDPVPTPAQADFFETRIRPVLAQNCLMCHGKDTQKSGLRLDSLAAMKAGGNSGPAIVPGDPAKSLLIRAVHQTGPIKMPPTGIKLPDNEIADLEAWVKMGAPWPESSPAAKAPAPLWSLQPVVCPPVPRVADKNWPKNPVDAFVLQNLAAHGLHPSPPADRRTLLRRVTYDLIGLPPTEDETEAFLKDKSPNAYEKVVDRLLASPHYGERQARLWMDVARYADTKGYVFMEDRNYPTAYTYRNWLIDSFNRDLPFDKFVIDQLAADQLPEVKSKQDREPLAAMGFLTLGRRFINNQQDIIDDRIDVTMRGFEGFTVECARCHDHKFDPIPTQDYYSLYAVFDSSHEAVLPISPSSISDPWELYVQRKSALEASIRQLVLAQVAALRAKVADQSAEVKQQLQSLGVGAVPDEAMIGKLIPAFDPAAREQLAKLRADQADLDRRAPIQPELTLAMVDDPNPHDAVVFHHGNPGQPGIAAPRRFLLALSKPGEERPLWKTDSGRLELAEDIASKDNPLTARVFVNRLWQDHFGAGIVRTPSNFGHQGERPTDPRLLDYLASTFMSEGWSIKKITRLMVTSATYRQSSNPSQQLQNEDPDNRLWGRMNRRRLDLEQLRDTIMAVAGRLQDSYVGGKSVDLWSQPFTPRRALYGFIERQNLPSVFKTFDFASPDSTSSGRFQTTVPQQALFLMNSPFVVSQAEALARRPEIAGAKDDAQRIRRLYLTLFQRLPDADELSLGLAYFRGRPSDVAPPLQEWQYGFGGYDAAAQRTVGFTPFAVFAHGSYHPTDKFPDPQLGYVSVTANGGHPGRDGLHASIRRWVSPYTGRVQILGELIHGQSQGDGVRGRIVSSRSGLLGEWSVHNGRATTNVASVDVREGDTLDFVLDCVANDAYDSFQWSPTIRRIDGKDTWSAAAEFGPPPPPPLSRIAVYAQALMMTNEFMFID